MLVKRTYICGICKKLLEADKTTAELMVESRQLFGPVKVEETMEICDDCFVWVISLHASGTTAN